MHALGNILNICIAKIIANLFIYIIAICINNFFLIFILRIQSFLILPFVRYYVNISRLFQNNLKLYVIYLLKKHRCLWRCFS